MIIEDTKENRQIQQVLATLAIENMYVDKAFIEELLKIGRGEKTTEQLRQEILEKYKQP